MCKKFFIVFLAGILLFDSQFVAFAEGLESNSVVIENPSTDENNTSSQELEPTNDEVASNNMENSSNEEQTPTEPNSANLNNDSQENSDTSNINNSYNETDEKAGNSDDNQQVKDADEKNESDKSNDESAEPTSEDSLDKDGLETDSVDNKELSEKEVLEKEQLEKELLEKELLEKKQEELTLDESEESITNDIEELYADGLPSADSLFSKYVDRKMGVTYYEDSLSTSLMLRRRPASSYLNDVEKVLYDRTLTLIEGVANGEISNTDIRVTPSDLDLSEISEIQVEGMYDYEIVDNTFKTTLNQEKFNAAKSTLDSNLAIDSKKIFEALRSDHPELLYWFGRSYSIAASGYSYGSVSITTSETSGTIDGFIKVPYFIIYLSVSPSYAVFEDGSTTSYCPQKADTTKTSATSTAVENARAIAESYASLNDYEKLLAFKKKICSLVTYNYQAAQASSTNTSMGSDPWELIYVFDNNPDTNVVCEGYSKAFQYLCDLSTFSGDVYVTSVTGTMDGGPHEWNIVSYNGKNYLADITNCDFDGLEEGHMGLFMKGYKSGNVSSGYVITRGTYKAGGYTYPASDINYIYDADTLNLYAHYLDELTLSDKDCEDNPIPPVDLEITQQPKSVAASTGETVTFTIKAVGVKSYQWYSSENGTSWQVLSGNTTDTLTISVSDTAKKLKYRCTLNGEDGTVLNSNVVSINDKFSIDTQPTNAIGNVGDTVSFTIKATGAKSYQWYSSSNGTSWTNLTSTGNKTETVSFKVTESNKGLKYRCVIFGTNGQAVNSDIVVIKEKFAITTQPQDAVGNVGNEVTFSIKAVAAKSYQWQYSTDGTTWNNMTATGSTSDTISFTLTEAQKNYKYRCVVTDIDGNTLNSTAVKITSKLTITTQPQNAIANVGETVNFNVKASGVKNYKWYTSENGTSWQASSLSGNTTDTLTVTVNSSNKNLKYRCTLTGEDGTVLNTSIVSITEKLAIQTQPTNAVGNIGDTVSFSVNAIGAKSYQWQSSSNGTSWSNITDPGYRTATVTITVTEAKKNLKYRCTLTGIDGTTATSDIAVINDKFAITTQPQDAAGEAGSEVTFSLKAVAAKSYQWQYKADGSTWTNLSATGSTTDTVSFTVTEAQMNQQFRCKVTGEDGTSLISDTVEINNKLAIITQPENQYGTMGDTVTLSVKAIGVKSYQWYYKDGSYVYKKMTDAGNDTDTVTISLSDKTKKYEYYCKLEGNDGTSRQTDTVKIYEKFEILDQPESMTVDMGRPARFTVRATGVKSYEWYYTENGTSWSTYFGWTKESLTVYLSDSNKNRKYRCTLTGEDGSTLYSDIVTAYETLKITTQPKDVIGNVGDTVTFSLNANGAQNYQWYYTEDGNNWKKLSVTGSDTNSVSFVVTEALKKQEFRCNVTSGDGSTLISDVVEIKDKLEIISQPKNATGNVGDKITFTVKAKGVKSYQWLFSEDNRVYKVFSVPGSDTDTLSFVVTEAQKEYRYTCRLEGYDGKYGSSDTVVIKDKPVESSQFEYGTISSTTGTDSNSTTRVRTGMYDLREKTISINVSSTKTRYGLYYYDSTKKFICSKVWLTGTSYDIPKNASFMRVCMSFSDNRTINKDDFSVFNSCLMVSDSPTVILPDYFEIGTIASNTGLNSVNKNRVRTDFFDLSKESVKISVGSTGTKYGVFFYDSSKNFIGSKVWITGTSYDIPKNASFMRVCMSFSDNRTINKDDFSVFNSCLMVSDSPTVILPDYFEIGTIASNTGLNSVNKNRVRTDFFDLSKESVKISVGSTGTKYGVFFYDSSKNFIGSKVWITSTSYDIPKNASFMRVCMSYSDNRTINKDDFLVFNSCIFSESLK